MTLFAQEPVVVANLAGLSQTGFGGVAGLGDVPHHVPKVLCGQPLPGLKLAGRQCFVQRLTFECGLRFQRGDKSSAEEVGRLAEGLGGDVQHSFDRLIGGGAVALDGELQKRHQVTHLPAGVKPHGALENIGDAVFDECLFQGAGVGIRAKEHHTVTESSPGLLDLFQRLGDKERFGVGVFMLMLG